VNSEPVAGSQYVFKEKFVAFIDLLGFKKMVEVAELEGADGLVRLLNLLNNFGSPQQRAHFAQHGPTTCPHANHIRRDLDFRIIQISDCAVLSAEVSPAGAINLISECWSAIIRFLKHGLMCRGYIAKGNVFHAENQVIGTAYQTAYLKERDVVAFRRDQSEKGTPFVEVSRPVADYIANCGDACVKEMFSRMVADDGEVAVLFPFKRLSHSFIIAGHGVKFNPDREKQSNDNLRTLIRDLKERVLAAVDPSDPDAVRKSEHYIRTLDEQLDMCDLTDREIERLRQCGF